MGTLQENVRRGAEWLDGEVPNWPSLVDFDRLDLRDSDNCVAGQVLGGGEESGYSVMLQLLRDSSDLRPDVTYGFTHPDGLQADAGPYSCHAPTDDPRLVELATLWRAEVAARLASAGGAE